MINIIHQEIQKKQEILKILPLYLGNTEKDVRNALKTKPAALLFSAKPNLLPGLNPFHLVFDWDSTVADEEGDNLISTKGRNVFCDHEWEHRHLPHKPGVLYPVFMAAISNSEFRVSVLTARTGKEAHRVLITLESWGVSTAALHFAGNQSKGPIAAAIQADLFFDDMLKHVKDAVNHGVNSAWIPIGNAKE